MGQHREAEARMAVDWVNALVAEKLGSEIYGPLIHAIEKRWLPPAVIKQGSVEGLEEGSVSHRRASA
jgi:hypothetical protein